jgi:alcohol dehydrogenase YqhD (iron-dependent ADH family)
MPNDFTFQNTTKIYFGRHQLHCLHEEILRTGRKVLMVYGGGSIKQTGIYDQVIEELQQNGCEAIEFNGIEPNPRHTTINQGAALCRKNAVNAILAVGGGSVIDASKAIAAEVCSDTENIWDLVEAHQPITEALPIFTVLTASATGSEADASAVISNMECEKKEGIGGPALRPTASFLNPEYTYSVPAYQTACGSFDIMSHTLDTKYFSKDPKMDMVYRMMDEHLLTVVKWAPEALQHPEDYETRANLMWASTWALNSFMTAGIAQAPSCHMMEHELSAVYDITHGHGLAILTPRWLSYILNEEAAPQIARLGTKVFGLAAGKTEMETAKAAIEALERFCFETLGLKSRLSDLGIDDSRFHEMAVHACGPNGVIKGFADLFPKDVEEIYHRCL